MITKFLQLTAMVHVNKNAQSDRIELTDYNKQDNSSGSCK